VEKRREETRRGGEGEGGEEGEKGQQGEQGRGEREGEGEGTKRRVSINFMIYKHVFLSDRLSSLSSCSFLFCS